MRNNIINYNIINIFKKKLIKGLKSEGRRNFLGRVCVRGKGFCNSSSKRKIRYLDFYRRLNKKGILLNIFYDPNRTGKIGLVLYENGLTSYLLIQRGLKIFDSIYSGFLFKNNSIKKGDSTILNNMPLFSIISNIESKPFMGSNLCRSAGVSALLINKNNKISTIKLNSS
jgi:large subunit ribosomal protein L2